MTFKRRELLRFGAIGVTGLAANSMVTGCAAAPRDAIITQGVADVVIIGGGISGLVAAYELQKSGCKNFIVLEARDRVGGRTLNQTVNGVPVESGATWIGPGQTAVYDLCRELGLGVYNAHWQGDMQLLAAEKRTRIPGQPGAPISDPKLLGRLEALAKTVPTAAPWTAPDAAALDAKSFMEWLRDAGMSAEELSVLAVFASNTFGATADKISALYALHYIHSAGSYTLLESMDGGAQQDRIEGGSQAITLELQKRLGDHIRLNSPVTSIMHWEGQGPIEVETGAGVVKARTAILALSPSQASAMDFSPKLPVDRQAVLDGWPVGGAGVTFHFGYSSPFWRKRGLSGLGVVLDPGGSILVADLSPEDGSSGILKSLGPSGSPAGDSAYILDKLVKFFGPEAATPTEVVTMDWGKESYTRGCVSPMAPGFLSTIKDSLAAPSGALHWAGTETATIWMGYMDGAVRAGRRASLEVLGVLAAAGGSG